MRELYSQGLSRHLGARRGLDPPDNEPHRHGVGLALEGDVFSLRHVGGARGDGEERVISSLAGVIVALRTLLAQPVGLADGGVQVDGQRIIARTCPSRPGQGDQIGLGPVVQLRRRRG